MRNAINIYFVVLAQILVDIQFCIDYELSHFFISRDRTWTLIQAGFFQDPGLNDSAQPTEKEEIF
jgi:hypothetical protein